MSLDVSGEWEKSIKGAKLPNADAFVGPLEQFSLAGGNTKIRLGEPSEPKGKFDLTADGVVIKLGDSGISLSGSGANGELVGTAPSASAEPTEASKGAVR
jgi:hypothetical protein